MKNGTEGQVTWTRELATFDAALRARGMAEKTRRAYGVDLQQLADWAARQDLDPLSIDPRTLRRVPGVVFRRGRSRAPSARQLPAVPGLFPPPLERGDLRGHPPHLGR